MIDGKLLGRDQPYQLDEHDLWEKVASADANGRLRAILDAVRSNRVADDFWARWSYAREDFERKLYRKRNKISVRFVELD